MEEEGEDSERLLLFWKHEEERPLRELKIAEEM